MRRSIVLTVLALVGCARAEPATRPAVPPPVPSAPMPAPEPAPAAELPEVTGPPVAQRRSLTEGEIALLEPLFGTSVDYAQVTVVDGPFHPFHPDDTYITPDGNIYAPGAMFRADFAAEDPWMRAVFVHEITHVW